MKKEVSETAAEAKPKADHLGRDAAGQLSDVAQSATNKIKAAADYIHEIELTAMAEDVKEIV
jgi:hypothetical protein